LAQALRFSSRYGTVSRLDIAMSFPHNAATLLVRSIQRTRRRGASLPAQRMRCHGCVRQPPRDGFADFYGYVEEPTSKATPVGVAAARDGFADFFGYPEDGDAVPAELHKIFLPDRDPVTPRSFEAEGAHPERQWMDATEASLALVRSQIESKRRLLQRVDGQDAEALKNDVLQLKLQQARLAGALWHSGESLR